MSGICLAQSASGGSAAPASPGPTSSATAANSTPPADRVVLKIGDTQITQEQFEAYIADLEALQGPADLSRKKLGENYASMLTLSKEATAQHLDSSPAVIRQLAIDHMQILSNAEFAKLKSEAKPTPEQISEYYNAHLEDYDVVQLRRVFIWKKGPNNKQMTADEVKAQAAAIRQAIASGTDPKKVVKNPDSVLIDAQPLKFQRGELPTAMEKPAFAMHNAGEWTELAEDQGTLVLLQLVSRSRRTLSEMTPQIEKKLQAQNLRRELDDLKKETGIWMDEEYFASHAPIPIPSTESETSGQRKLDKERGENEDQRK